MNHTVAAGRHLTLAGLLLLVLSACETPPKLEHTGPVLALRMELHGAYAERLSREHRPPAVRLWMEPVAGSIWGRPSGARFADSRIQGSGRFGVSLGDMEAVLARAARGADSRSLTFFPAETRIARLAAISSVSGDEDRNYDTTLRDSRTGQILLLIYVDRPCHIRGSLGDNPVDVSPEHPGLHWLEMTHTSTGKGEAARLITLPPEVIIRLDPL